MMKKNDLVMEIILMKGKKYKVDLIENFTIIIFMIMMFYTLNFSISLLITFGFMGFYTLIEWLIGI